MRKKGVLRQFFGVSQEEIAMILKISRAQWSMFESGKAELPHDARIEYYDLLAYVQSAKDEVAKKGPNPAQSKEEALKFYLVVNQHRQGLTSRKIENLQKKQAMAEAALHLEGYYENSKQEQPKFVGDKIEEILKRANKDVQLGDSAEMIQLQIKLKVLRYEETLLEAVLEK